MGEIVTFQLGSCGNNIGTKFWEILGFEHEINTHGNCEADDDLPYEQLGVFFEEESAGRYLPRTVVVDLDESSIETVKNSYFGALFPQTNFCVYGSTSSRNWAKGYNLGEEMLENVMDIARRQTQKCEAMQGMQLIHSLGGGAGSGMGSILIEKLKDAYPNSLLQCCSIVPSHKFSSTQMESYNTVLALSSIMTHSDYCLPIDNQALYDICTRTLHLPTPVKGDLNNIVVNALSGVTCTLRTPSLLNGTMRRLAANLVPFPRLKFLTLGTSPIFARGSCYRSLTLPQTTQRLFDAKNILIGADVRHGRYLSVTIIYRGHRLEAEDIVAFNPCRYNSSYFVQWIPNNVMTGVCQLPQYHQKIAGALIGNSTAVKIMLQRVHDGFNGLFKRKRFLHCFQEEGVEEQSIADAGERLIDLIAEYQQYQDMTAETDEDEQQNQQEAE